MSFASKNVERVAEPDLWQLHRNYGLIQNSSTKNISEVKSKQQNINDAVSIQFLFLRCFQSDFFQSKKQPNRLSTPGDLKFVILRHAERVDLVFGQQWLDTSFDHYGNYRRTNLNMPQQVPPRASKRDFYGDSPITEIGKVQAKLTGEALKSETFNFQFCYVSPSLRSIQTAHHILEGLNNNY